MNYKNYQASRDLSWQILIEQKICTLPVKISDICKNMGIALHSYQKGKMILNKLGVDLSAVSDDGFSILCQNTYLIFYNGDLKPTRIRFTVAHELGHILLGHTGKYKLVNREISSKDNPIEQAANVFASRILAPACVLHDLNLHTPKEISQFCDITYTAAEFRAERMEQLYTREKKFIRTRGKSCFGLSPLERQVQKQFENYVKDNL